MATKPVTSPAPLYRIEKRLTPKAKAAFAKAVKAWQAQVAAGKPPDPKALGPLVEVTKDGTRLAGAAAAVQVNALRGPSIRLNLAFDLTNPLAVKWAKQNATRLIDDLGTTARQVVKRATIDAIKGELTTQQVARVIRSRIGLTVRQNDAVQNFYERALAAGYDTADALDEMYAYTEKLTRYRSEVIARSEVLRAENAGQELLWEQGKASGALTGFKRIWIATPDELLCPICEAMNGTTTEIGQPWEGEDGTYDTPQDSHPQCRCSEALVEGR